MGGDVLIDKKTYAYVWPEFEVPLAAGSYSIEVMRGTEYEPETVDLEVTSSGALPVEISLARWSDIREQGWFSGDTHVHFVDPRTAFLEGKAEDLSVVNILATKWGELITDVQKFRGGPEPFSDKETVGYVNEECRHGFLGHTVLMDLEDLVYPLTWGPPSEGVYGGIDYPAMAMQADKTHSQGGFVGWAHFPYPNGEIAIDVALGKVDTVDLFTWGDSFGPRGQRPGPIEVYYRFLNCGFDLPATSGTDKMWNTQGLISFGLASRGLAAPSILLRPLRGLSSGRRVVTFGELLRPRSGRQTIAVGASPRKVSPPIRKPWKGERDLSSTFNLTDLA